MFIFPYKVGRRLQRVPWVTIVLIALNIVASVAFFAVMLGVAMSAIETAKTAEEFVAILVERLGWWMFYPDWRGLYTWFTSSFIHGDLIHLGSNMFFLWLFGSVVEDAVGRWRYLALYLGGAAAAAALYALTELVIPGPAKLSLGASGALAAVMAIFAARFYKTKMRFFYFYAFLFRFKAGTFETTSVTGVGIWAFAELLYGVLQFGGISNGTAHWAHLGGLVFGVAAAYTLGFIKDAGNDYLLDDIAMYTAAGAHGAAAVGYAKLAESDATNPFWQLAHAREDLLAGGKDAEGAGERCTKAMETLLRQGRKIEVLDAYEQLAGVLAPSAALLLAIGSAAEGGRRYELAEQVYGRLLQEHGERPEAEKTAFRLAHVRLAPGREADARTAWREFLGRWPESSWVQYADARLASITAAPAAPAAPPADGLPTVPQEPSAENGWTF